MKNVEVPFFVDRTFPRDNSVQVRAAEARPCVTHAHGRPGLAGLGDDEMSSLTPEDAPLTSQGQPRGVRSARQRGGSRSPPEDADAEPSSGDFSGGSPPGGNARRMRHVAKQFLGTYYRDLNDAPERVTRHYTVRRPRALHSNQQSRPVSHPNTGKLPFQHRPFRSRLTHPTHRDSSTQEDSVLTIEDAAELRLQQPHWLPLETRPPNLEGQGAITIGDLVKNALRMRPDRIILGEIRGAECFDLLAAMNTGHDGSMCTLHANSPRECLGRMENMILMGDIKIPKEAISRQIAESVDIIVQVKRLRDGSRRTTNITEVIGMEGDVIVTQELFKFEYLDEGDDGKIMGEYRSSGLRPYTLEKARQFGFDQAYLEACL